MEGHPVPVLGVVVERHLHVIPRSVAHGHPAGERTGELGVGPEQQPRDLPEAVGEGPRAFLLRGRKG